MPTYEYLCDNCGHKFEKFQMMSASLLKKCPECAKMKLKRLIGTGAGIIFKGNGFYETDYRSENYKKSQTSEKNNVSSPDKKKNEAKKVDNKPSKPAKTEK